MEAEQLFDLIEQTIRGAAKNSEPALHVYVEREMRGTFPTLAIRVLPGPRLKKPKPGAKMISTPDEPSDQEWVMSTDLEIPSGAGS